MKIAQMIVKPIYDINIEEVKELSDSKEEKVGLAQLDFKKLQKLKNIAIFKKVKDGYITKLQAIKD